MLGAVIFPHGAQKLLGWFGGYGVSGTIEHFVSHYHVPAPIAFLVILGEHLLALALALPVMLKGAGRFAVDGALRSRLVQGDQALLTPKPAKSS